MDDDRKVVFMLKSKLWFVLTGLAKGLKIVHQIKFKLSKRILNRDFVLAGQIINVRDFFVFQNCSKLDHEDCV